MPRGPGIREKRRKKTGFVLKFPLRSDILPENRGISGGRDHNRRRRQYFRADLSAVPASRDCGGAAAGAVFPVPEPV